MNTPKTIPQNLSPPKDSLFGLMSEAEEPAEPLNSAFKHILEREDFETGPEDLLHIDRFPNNVQLPDSSPKLTNIDRSQTHEIAQEIVKQIEVSQSEHRSEARISVEVQGATLWIRVKQRTRGVDVTLRTKDRELKKQLHGTKSDLSDALQANDVTIRRLKIV